MGIWLAVFVGGGLGSMLRFWLSLRLLSSSHWPWGTWTVNALGCLLAGALFASLDLTRAPMYSTRVLLLVGFCGGFTTFSAFALELWLLAPQRPRLATAYFLSTIVVTLVACGIGLWLGRALRSA
jgi:CrcB protein